MDKNTITGFVLIAALLIGFSYFNTPSAEQQEAMQREQDSIAAVHKQKEVQEKLARIEREKQAAEKALNDTTYALHDAMTGEGKDITLENEKVRLTFSTKGAIVTKAVVKNFKNQQGDNDVTLFEGKDQGLKFLMEAKEHNINTAELVFTPSKQTSNELTLEAGNGTQKVVISYQLGKDYLLHAQLHVEGMKDLFSPSCNTMTIDWSEKCRQQEKGFSFENRYATLTYHETDGGTDYLSETSEKIDEAIEEPIDWVAFKNQFFSAVMISKDGYQKDALLTSKPLKKDTGYLKDYNAKLKTAFDPTGIKASEFEFYFGPNDFRLLQEVQEQSTFGKDLEMERLVYLGWPLFRYINRWFTLYIFDGLTSLAIPMGIVLILITLILKVITFPLVKKSYLSSAKMRVLRPKLDEATKQYNKPEDQMQKQQAMMTMYSKYGVSPMSGCLPMLIQMPIWIAMFNFVPNAIQLRGQSFLWIDDLSAYDVLMQWDTNLWLIGDHLSLTCILFCASNLLYSWFTMRQQRDQMVGQQAEQMKMMQWMMFLMPLMFFFVFNDYSAGLNFYYFISLFCSAAIMFALRKTTNDEKLLAQLEKKYKENEANPKKMKGLAASLERMQQQQQEMERRRQELRNKRLGK